MRERPSQLGTLPDPMLSVRYHNEKFSELTFDESDFSFVEIAAEQEVPFPGKLSLRREIAEHEAERERAMRDMTLLMVLSGVATAWAELEVADRSEAILRESARTLALIREQTAARYAVGHATQQDVLRAGLEIGGIEERRVLVERGRAASAAKLNAWLGREAAFAIPRVSASETSAALGDVEELRRRLADFSPAIRAARLEVLRGDAALRLARREYLPNFALMGGYMNKGSLYPEWELGVRIEIPLYYWRKQSAGVAEASFARSSAKHAWRNAELSLEGRVTELHAMGDAAARLLRLYGESLIPRAMATFESARASYDVGRVDFLTTVSAFMSLLEYRMRQVEEAGNLAIARAELAPLLGETPLGEALEEAP